MFINYAGYTAVHMKEKIYAKKMSWKEMSFMV